MDFVGRRKWFLSLSAVLIVVSIVMLLTPPGLNLGIDFTSGTSISLDFTNDVDTGNVRTAFAAAGHGDAIIQSTGGNTFFVRTTELGQDGLDEIVARLDAAFPGAYTVQEVTTVGKSVAGDTVRNAVIAVAVAAAFVMVFLFWAFRSVPGAYRYSLGAVIALAHDVLLTLGAFAILGRLINTEVNATFIVGTLTVIGYSVNDTIVVFDRIRENVNLGSARSFRQTVNQSLNESLMRSLGTSFTTALVIVAMLLFGGQTLRDFLLVLLIGVVVGTYSSIFIAAQTVVFWEEGGVRGLLRRRRGTASETA